MVKTFGTVNMAGTETYLTRRKYQGQELINENEDGKDQDPGWADANGAGQKATHNGTQRSFGVFLIMQEKYLTVVFR